MWDSPRLISAAASILYAVALGLVAYGGARFLSLSSAFPLKTVVVQGELQRVTRAAEPSDYERRKQRGYYDNPRPRSGRR